MSSIRTAATACMLMVFAAAKIELSWSYHQVSRPYITALNLSFINIRQTGCLVHAIMGIHVQLR